MEEEEEDDPPLRRISRRTTTLLRRYYPRWSLLLLSAEVRNTEIDQGLRRRGCAGRTAVSSERAGENFANPDMSPAEKNLVPRRQL